MPRYKNNSDFEYFLVYGHIFHLITSDFEFLLYSCKFSGNYQNRSTFRHSLYKIIPPGVGYFMGLDHIFLTIWWKISMLVSSWIENLSTEGVYYKGWRILTKVIFNITFSQIISNFQNKCLSHTNTHHKWSYISPYPVFFFNFTIIMQFF